MIAAANPNGADLAGEIELIAATKGLSPARFIAPLTDHPHRFLQQLRRARQPTEATVERVRTFLRDMDDRTSLRDEVAQEAKRAAARRALARVQGLENPLPARGHDTDTLVNGRAAIDREPCFKCGTRADIGCRHRPVYKQGD